MLATSPFFCFFLSCDSVFCLLRACFGSYLNFVKPWTCVEGEFKHDVGTNVKQFGCWTKLYAASGATVPECWPKQVPTPVFFLGKSKRPSRAIVFLLFFAH